MPQRRRKDGADGRPADGQALARLLDMPQLAKVVPHVAPEVLHRLIRHAGLERCVDIVEAASRDQLRLILDLDLWRAPRAGGDEEFDAERFGEWIETLVDRDAATAAAVVARLDESVVVTGLSRYVRVIDPGVLEPTESTDDEWESGLFIPTGLTAEVGGYIVQARRKDTWDAVVSLLVALSLERRESFDAVMRGCRRLSDGLREPDGLHDLLGQPEQLLHDVAVDRDDRRTARGFGSVADARAFLALARRPRASGRHENPVAVAWFRGAEAASAEDAAARRDPAAALHPPVPPPALDPVVAGALEELAQAFPADDVVPERPLALLVGSEARQGESGGVRPLMEYLREHHPEVCLTRGRELAFLANTLVAGCGLQSRPFSPREALDAVVATCSLGLLREAGTPAPDYLVGHDLIGSFEDGWATLHGEVSLFVADGLLAVLRAVAAGDSDTLEGLSALRQSLETHVSADAPWRAAEALDALSTLDTPAWHGLLGLLSECPVLPAVVDAIVERRTGRIDPKAFTFIATAAHLDTVRAFMARLPELLAE
jgi:hypothetical protein